MGAIIGFFTGPLGKIAMYAIGAVFAAGLIWAAWSHYDGLVTKVATQKAKIDQYEQVIKDQKDFIQKTEDLIQLQNDSITKLDAAKIDIEGRFKTLSDYLGSKEAIAGDRVSSEVLKNTIRKLKEIEQ